MNIASSVFRTVLLIVAALAFVGCAPIQVIPPTVEASAPILHQPKKVCSVESDSRGNTRNGDSRTTVRDVETCIVFQTDGQVCEITTTYTTVTSVDRKVDRKTGKKSSDFKTDRYSDTKRSCRRP